MGPAGLAGIAAAGAVVKAISSRKKASGFRPNRGYIKGYEKKQYEDINKLYSPDAFSGPGIGFTKEQMAARMGLETGEAQAEYKSNLGAIEQDASRGSLKRSSGAYFRNKQRASGGLLARTSDIRRRNILADAVQSRRDLYSRLGAVGGAYGQGVSIYNAMRPGQSTLNTLGQAAGEGMIGYAGAYTAATSPKPK